MRRLLPLLLLTACGGPARQTLDDCDHGPRTTFMPRCVDTARGVMRVEDEYIPGVVACEIGSGPRVTPALEAQAIAARTYLAAWLQDHGEDAPIPLGPSFQCWKPGAGPAAKLAAQRTADIVLAHDWTLITANYAAGTRHLAADCTPRSPAESGYDYPTWDAMRAAFDAARRAGRWPGFGGTDWTEILVTRNAGKAGPDVDPTPLAGLRPANRGALGQNAARCLADVAGYGTLAILRYFYGDDVRLSAPLPDEDPPEPSLARGGP
jgi:hypothetical protein